MAEPMMLIHNGERRWLSGLLCLGLLAVAFALFANTFGHQWTYDDYPVIVDNPDVRSLAGFVQDSYPGRPLREFTYLLDHAAFGMQPRGWHVQNIFWHGLAGFLAVLLMIRQGAGRPAAALAGLLFVVHPVTVEAVANISHRKESLALVFMLLALLAHHRACLAGRLRYGWLVAAFALTGMAYLGKQTAVVTPVIMLACEWVFIDRSRWLLLRWWKVLASLAVASLAGMLGWLAAGGGGSLYLGAARGLLAGKANYFGPFDLGLYARVLCKSWALGFSKLVFPVDLAAEYVVPVPSGWLDPWVLGGLLLVAGALALLAWSGRRRSPVFFWLAMAGLCYLPVANVWPLAYLVADRYLYAPWAALAMLTGWLLTRPVWRPVRSLVAGALLATVLATLTWQQNRVWASEETLWQHAAKVNPTSGFALNNLGNIYFLRDDLLHAREYYLRAVAVNPLNPTAQFNLGLIYERTGNLAKAFDYYRKFLILDDPLWARERELLQQRLLASYHARFADGAFLRSP